MELDLSGIAAALLAGVVVVAGASRLPRSEGAVVVGGYVAHLAAALAQVAVMRWLYRGEGDLFTYAYWGGQIADSLALHFESAAPEVLRLLFQQDALLPVDVPHADSSTGSMAAISGILAFLVGSNPTSLCIGAAIFSFFGKCALVQFFRENLAPKHHVAAVACVMLVPSVVFWSSGLLKEAFAVGALGWLVLAAGRVVNRRVRSGLLFMLPSAVAIALLKPYVLFAVAPGVGVWVWWRAATQRQSIQLRPLQLLGGTLVAVLGVAALGAVFPQYAIENLADEATYHQDVGQVARGGSTYELVPGGGRGLVAQLAFAPLALISSLYRPFLLEATSGQVAVNALETTVLLGLTARMALGVPVTELWSRLRRAPALAFCIVFAIVFGTAVGLGTTNLGTLSRYRMPLVPFFAVVLVVLGTPSAGSARSEEELSRNRPT